MSAQNPSHDGYIQDDLISEDQFLHSHEITFLKSQQCIQFLKEQSSIFFDCDDRYQGYKNRMDFVAKFKGTASSTIGGCRAETIGTWLGMIFEVGAKNVPRVAPLELQRGPEYNILTGYSGNYYTPGSTTGYMTLINYILKILPKADEQLLALAQAHIQAEEKVISQRKPLQEKAAELKNEIRRCKVRQEVARKLWRCWNASEEEAKVECDAKRSELTEVENQLLGLPIIPPFEEDEKVVVKEHAFVKKMKNNLEQFSLVLKDKIKRDIQLTIERQERARIEEEQRMQEAKRRGLEALQALRRAKYVKNPKKYRCVSHLAEAWLEKAE